MRKILALIKGFSASIVILMILFASLMVGAGAGVYFSYLLGTTTPEEIDIADLPRAWYRVQEGDTLEGIATKFMPRGYNVQKFKQHLIELNGLEPGKIEYDKLIIVYDGRGVQTSRWGMR